MASTQPYVPSHTLVEEVADLTVRLGTEALLAKVDTESAYRLIPVHPKNQLLLIVCWEDKIYVKPMLPFGLRSAPKILT